MIYFNNQQTPFQINMVEIPDGPYTSFHLQYTLNYPLFSKYINSMHIGNTIKLYSRNLN
jgi:hypothetical protein